MAREPWTIKTILEWTKQYFDKQGVEDSRLDAELLLCEVLQCQRVRLFLDYDKPLAEEELSRFKDMVIRRAKGAPIAYILGRKEFMGLEFKVNDATLIPRPETELLVESVVKAAKGLKEQGDVKILDIGTGSGAIIVSALVLLPEAKGVGVDISLEALKVAKENAMSQELQGRIGFLQSDLFSRIPPDKKFDIIVSNPPYIPTAIVAGLAREVQQEPKSALDGGKDGLYFYRKIIKEAQEHMEPTGLLAFEIGYDQGAAVMELCRQAGFKQVALRKDYANLDRMVFALKEEGEGGKYEDLLLEITRKW